MKKLYLGIITVLLLLGCGDNSASSGGEENAENSLEATSNTVEAEPQQSGISPDIVTDILQAIPSPLEISLLIKEQEDASYNPSDLNPTGNVDGYTTNFQKAINLGIYGTDLGYANVYGKNQDALKYLGVARDLADDLNIGEFFDYSTMRRLAEQASNLDSLLIETTRNFNDINYHLREQKREYLSVLLLTGGWLEALYLTCLVNEKSSNDLLREKIGDQKFVLDQLLLVLDVYKTKAGFKGLIDDLTELQTIYDQIDVDSGGAGGATVTEDENGNLIVVPVDEGSINITDAHVQTITSLTKSIRGKLIK